MNITPDYIRAKQEEHKMTLVGTVDTIMQVYVNDLVCTSSASVKHKDIMTQGIPIDDFINELRGRGFSCENDSGRYFEDGAIFVTLSQEN